LYPRFTPPDFAVCGSRNERAKIILTASSGLRYKGIRLLEFGKITKSQENPR
jgi:hypothetical protein